MANIKVKTWISNLGEVEVCSQKELMDKYGITHRKKFTQKRGAPDNREQPRWWHSDYPKFQAFWKSEEDFNAHGFTKKKMYTAELTRGHKNQKTGDYEWFYRHPDMQYYLDALDDLAGRNYYRKPMTPNTSRTYISWFKATYDIIENRAEYISPTKPITKQQAIDIMTKDFEKEVKNDPKPGKYDSIMAAYKRSAVSGCKEAQRLLEMAGEAW